MNLIVKMIQGSRLEAAKKVLDFIWEFPWLPELIQLARWDNMGRVVNCNPHYSRKDIVDKLNKAIRDHWFGKDPFPLKEVINER